MNFGPRTPLALALPAIASALLVLAQAATAQATNDAKTEGLERAQKAADSVFHWIKLNAQNGASRQQAAPAPAPAPVAARKPAAPAVASAPKPAPAPVQAAASTPPATVAAVAAVTTETAAEAPPPPDSATLVASAAPTPAPDAPLAAAAKAVEPPPAPPEEADDDEPLQLLSKVDPVIPRQLQQTGFRRDIVQVRFTIGTDGKIEQASVMKAHNRRLGAAAVEAVKQWRFAPIHKAREVGVEFAFQNEE